MSVLEIAGISRVRPDGDIVENAYLDCPQVGTRVETADVAVQGWVVGRADPATCVEICAAGFVWGRFPVKGSRPDVAAHFPGCRWAGRSGFSGSVDLMELRASELVVRAVFPGGRRVDVATVTVRHAWVDPKRVDEQDLVSVVIPCFNQAHFLAEAIDSALAQTYPRVEVVVIDDGSTDNTVEMTARYDRVRYVYQRNRGLSAARNAGLRRSNGEFVMFLDADDRLCPDAVTLNVNHLRQHPDCAFVYGAYRLIRRDGVLLDDQVRGGAVVGEAYASLLKRNHIGMHATVMYRREVFQTVKGFNEALDACEDYDLFLRIVRLFPVSGHGGLVAEYRLHGASMSADPVKMLRTSLAVLKSQRSIVRRDRALREAYREGLRFLRTYYGQRILTRAETAPGWAAGRWQGLRRLLVVARYAPGLLLSAPPAPDQRR